MAAVRVGGHPGCRNDAGAELGAVIIGLSYVVAPLDPLALARARAIDKPLAPRPSSGAAAGRPSPESDDRCTSRFSCLPFNNPRRTRRFVAFAIPLSRRMAVSSFRSMVTSTFRRPLAARGVA